MSIELGKPRPPYRGVLIITTPEREFKIDGLKVCLTDSPEVCWEEDPNIIRLRLAD